jgi:hypothetical protein
VYKLHFRFILFYFFFWCYEEIGSAKKFFFPLFYFILLYFRINEDLRDNVKNGKYSWKLMKRNYWHLEREREFIAENWKFSINHLQNNVFLQKYMSMATFAIKCMHFSPVFHVNVFTTLHILIYITLILLSMLKT